MHQDPMQCGYPSYGYYSAGEVAAKTIPFSNNIAELSRKILRIGKETLPAKIAGIYTGRHPHSTQLAGGNESNVFVENMGLLEEKKNTRWPGQKALPWLELSFTTRTKSFYQHHKALLCLPREGTTKGRNHIQISDRGIGTIQPEESEMVFSWPVTTVPIL